MVATSRAKHKIRHWLNTEQKHRSIDLGRKLIEKEAKRYKVQWRKLVAENALDGVLHEYASRGSTISTPTSATARSRRGTSWSARHHRAEGDRQKAETADEGVLGRAVRKIFPFSNSAQAIKVKGYDDLMTYLAKCCTPFRGSGSSATSHAARASECTARTART